MSLRNALPHLYARAFGSARFGPWNRMLLDCAVRALGANVPVRVNDELMPLVARLAHLDAPIVFDVGANHGHFAMALRRAIPRAQIYAFEPSPKTFSKLADLAKDAQFTAFNIGCGSETGQRTLYDRCDMEAGTQASMFENVIGELHGAKARAIPVDIDTIDAILKRLSIQHLHVLKIDVEGAELDVLKGAKGAIDEGRIDIIQFEFNDMNLYSRVFMQDFFKLLPRHKFFRIGLRSLIPITRDAAAFYNEIFAYQNVLAIADGATPPSP